MSAFRPMFVIAPPEPPRDEDIEYEARLVLAERQAQRRLALGRAPSWIWSPVAFENWCAARRLIDDMTPSEYDRIEARNRLRDGRSLKESA